MSSQFEMFECAAECERLMDAASDPLKKQTLEKLRDMWIALANEGVSVSPALLAMQLEQLGRVQSDLAS
jgi:hypothetical protein